MKTGTPELLKFRRLQRRLGVSKVVLVGTLELLWIETIKNAPRGDIGRFTNAEIATLCEWEGDDDEFVEALVETGWLDECYDHRLVVHDWDLHAPKYLKGGLSKKGEDFAIANSSKPVAIAHTLASGLEHVASRAHAQPNLTYSNQTKPNQTNGAAGGVCESEQDVDEKPKRKAAKSPPDGFEEFYRDYPNKNHRDDAERAFAKLTAAKRQAAIASVAKYPDWCKAHGIRGDPRPYQNPSTYLNSGTYRDVLAWEPTEVPQTRIPQIFGKDE